MRWISHGYQINFLTYFSIWFIPYVMVFLLVFFVASTDIIMDLSCKLQKPNVALVHQMPFYTDLPGFAGTIDKVRCLFLDIIRFNSKILT
jgi:hypothetical protein